jgi:2,4-dichlorophenol 6-monooxygenase
MLVGVPDLDVTIEATSSWTVNDAYATRLSDRRVFCLGDAVHRHPPTNGLGSNVSIGDAYNVSWKLAHVLRGQADPCLLDSYEAERAPVARQTVMRANKSLGDFPPILAALGLLDTSDPDRMSANMAALRDTDTASEQQRTALRTAIDSTHYVYNTHGVEMNQRYTSAAVVPDGTPEPEWQRDSELYYQPSTRPGAPLPHAWLNRGRATVSTHDLVGHGGFTLLTGSSGHAWCQAVKAVAAKTGVPIAIEIIGPGQTTEDPFGEFAAVRETDESGALLVRPDHIVAWRRHAYDDGASEALLEAMTQLLRPNHPIRR